MEASFQNAFEKEELLDNMWQVNAKAPLVLSSLADPYLNRSHMARIINIVSLNAKEVGPSSDTGYSMSKFAAMAGSLATQKASKGVRVTAICPSYVNTDMVAGIDDLTPEEMIQPETLAEIVSMILKLPKTILIPELTVKGLVELELGQI